MKLLTEPQLVDQAIGDKIIKVFAPIKIRMSCLLELEIEEWHREIVCDGWELWDALAVNLDKDGLHAELLCSYAFKTDKPDTQFYC